MCVPEHCSSWRAPSFSMEALVIAWPFKVVQNLASSHHCLSFLGRQGAFPQLWLHLWLEVVDPGFISGHKSSEEAKLSFSVDKLCWIHFWSGPRSFGTQWADTLWQCYALYSFVYIDAARTLVMVSCVVMVFGLPRQLTESPCHSLTQQPTFFTMLIWRDILP